MEKIQEILNKGLERYEKENNMVQEKSNKSNKRL